MKRICLLVLFTFLSRFSYSQDWNLLKTFPMDTVYLTFNTQDYEGNIYIAGSFKDSIKIGNIVLYSQGSIDAYVFKFDKNGQVIWGEGIGNIKENRASGIAVDLNKNIYLNGYFEDTLIYAQDTLISHGAKDFMILKMDSLGNSLWARSGGTKFDEYGSKIRTDQFGNLSLAISVGPNTINTDTIFFENEIFYSYGNSDILLLQLSPNGNTKMIRHFGSPGFDGAGSILVDVNGNHTFSAIIKSTTAYFGNDTINALYWNGTGCIIRCDSVGDLKWINGIYSTSTTGLFGIHDITQDSYGNCYFIGTFNCPQLHFGIYPGGSVINLPLGYTDGLFVSKFDKNGNFKWVKNNVGGSPRNSFLVEVDSNENIYNFGSLPGGATSFGGKVLNNTNDGNIFMWKCDTAGNEKAFTYFGSNNYTPSSISKSTNQDICINGLVYNTSLSFGTLTENINNHWTLYLARFSPKDLVDVGITQNYYSPLSIDILPNPASDFIQISINNCSGLKKIQIVNLEGQILYSINTTNNNLLLPVSEWLKGLYFVNVQAQQQKIIQKVIINH